MRLKCMESFCKCYMGHEMVLLYWFLVMNVILDCTESILLVLMLKAIEESNGVQPLIVSMLFKWIVMEAN